MKSKEYTPELGQAFFGQPWKKFEASNLLIAALEAIKQELDRVMWNKYQKEYSSPFDDTGNRYKNETFEVVAYSWDDEKEQPYNFRWVNKKTGKPLEVSWYKYLGRGTSVNRKVSPAEIEMMLDECLESLEKEDKLY